MPFKNLQHLYDHLPARFRRDDKELFLKRFLTYFGNQLDKFDNDLDTFHFTIAPETAPEEFIDWWVYAFFGWGWFPSWFTLPKKRAFYANISQHYARRGTKRGIEEFMRAFGIKVRVITHGSVWGEWSWGDSSWAITGPLGIIVQLLPLESSGEADLNFWGDFVWSEGHLSIPQETLTRADVEALLRFQWPLGQVMMIEDLASIAI